MNDIPGLRGTLLIRAWVRRQTVVLVAAWNGFWPQSPRSSWWTRGQLLVDGRSSQRGKLATVEQMADGRVGAWEVEKAHRPADVASWKAAELQK